MRHVLFGVLVCWGLLANGGWWAHAGDGNESSEISPEPRFLDPRGIHGSLLICGGGELPVVIWQRFVELAGGDAGRLVLIPTAGTDPTAADRKRFIETWRQRGMGDVEIVHTRSRAEADEAAFVEPLRKATAVWLGGGQQLRLATAYSGTRVEQELRALLQRGGVIGGTSAGAAVMSRVMIAGGNPTARTAVGFDLLPDAVVDQHFTQRQRAGRLRTVLHEHPGTVGYGVDEGTALLVQQRRMEVLGTHQVTICLAESSSRPAREFQLSSSQVADLTAMRRAARERTLAPFPAHPLRPTVVPHGTLLLAGGGGLPIEVGRRFVELAGGPDALIVILPTAAEKPDPQGSSERRLLERAGAKNLVVLPGIARSEVESESSLNPLKQAKGIWFGGGRQWRFVDAYQGTQVVPLLHEVLKRGGVIGGSSAGASIQAEYLVRGSPLGNQEMMAEGYERGFGFLPGTAVDQHFTQRNRRPDMEALMETFPQLLGIGLDEGSALIIRNEIAEVVGSNQVYFFDRANDSENLSPIEVPAGKGFNLRTRKPIP